MVAAFVCMDAVREEAAEAVRLLHDLRVRTVMLTGDNHTAALAVQAVTGVQVCVGGACLRLSAGVSPASCDGRLMRSRTHTPAR